MMCESTEVDLSRAIMDDLDDIRQKIKEHVRNWLPSKKKFVTVLWIINALLSHASCQNLDYPPNVFTLQPQGGSTFLKDNSKLLVCMANGEPKPVYRWKKDGVFVSEHNSTESTLVIESLKESDAGEYQCIAANLYGALLSIRVNINVAYIKSFNSVSNREISVEQGHAAIIDLPSIDSYPDPSVNWYEGVGIIIGSNSQRYHITLSNQLVVLETKLTDSDKRFTATAVNVFTGESDSSDPFILKVQDAGNGNSEIYPEIVVPPQHTTAVQPRDTFVTLECVANARPLNYVSLKWYKVVAGDKTELTIDNNKYIVSFYRRQLTIRNPSTDDSGVYECEAQFDNIGGGNVPSVSAQANLTIYVAPTFTNPPPRQLNRDFGTSTTIACQATGIPTPTITWYKNAVEIDVSNNQRYSMDDTNLQISDLMAQDTGMYQCFATNDAGETNGATRLRVFSSAPTITSPPQNQSVLTNDVVRFTCDVSGAPLPDITWFRALTADTIEEELPGVNGRIEVKDQELVINLSEIEDSGKYMCNATNSKGSASAEAYLKVRLRTQIILPPQDSKIIKGSTAVLDCSVEHDDTITPTWTWYHKGQVIPTGDLRRTVQSDGSLRIKSIRNTDKGIYKCDVTSEGGNDDAHANITVIELPYPPSVNHVALNAEEKRAVDIVWSPGFDGNSGILKFTVEYRLVPPGVQLLPEDGWLVSNDDLGALKTSYTVRNLQPARVYQFRVSAWNNVGQGGASPASEEVEIPQEAPTGPPLDVSGSPRSNNSIRIKWSPPEQEHWNGYLLGYNLRYKPSGYPDSTLTYEDINNLVTLFDLVGLIVFQEYEIAVAAYNAKGVGVYSNYIKVRTKEGIPTAPPTRLQAEAITSTIIKLLWQPPDPQHINGINMGYKLMVRRQGLESEPADIVSIPSDTSNILGTQTAFLENLEKFTGYSISVLCYTSVGDGPVSNTVSEVTREDDPEYPITFTVYSVPDQVGNLRFANILDTSLDVIWTPPEHSNGILTGYTLKYNVKNQPLSLVSKNFGPDVLNYTVRNLEATTQYTFDIFALTSTGAGPSRTADIESGVPPEIPEPPTNVAVTDIEGRSVTLRFTPGFNGYTSISKWIIEAQMEVRVRRQTSNTGGWFLLAEIVDPDADKINVPGLRPYAKYRLRITAVNVAGKSVPSDPTDWFDTLQTAPNVPPSDLELRVLNETAIKIGWTPLAIEDWNGENRGYLLEAKLSELTTWNIKRQVTDQHAVNYVLSELEEYTSYDVRVASFNNIGNSPYTGVVNITTRESVPSAGPQSVRGTAVNSTSILVTWEPVPKMQQNGLIMGYKIQYSTTEDSEDVAYKEVDGSETVMAHVIGLKKFVEYRLQVLAFTRIGDGSLSTPAIVVKTHEDVPGPPSSVYFPVVNWTSVKVVWSPPTEPNGIIKGYQVTYRQDQDSPNNAVVNGGLEDYQREYRVSGLTRDTFYTFEISAKTSRGWGTAAVLQVRTILNRRVPDAPTAPGIANDDIGDRWVTITWQAGSDGYGPIRNFTIQYQQNEGSWETVMDYVPHTLDAFHVSGLKPNSNYKFQVAASNDVGTSEYSLSSRLIVTLQAAPESAPQNLQVEPKTKTSVLITWEPPPRHAWNGPLLGFRLEYRRVDQSQWLSELLTTPTIDQLILTTLPLFESYEFRIMAFNEIGDSPWSPVLVVYIEIVPSAPPRTLVASTNSSTEIRLSWIPPLEDTHNGKLLGYKIFYQLSGENQTVQSLQVPATTATTVIQGLSIYTEYNFSMQAYNRAGDGPNTTLAVYAWTDEGIPGRPGPLKFAVTSLTAVNVSWTAPEEENGVITKYTLSYYQEDTVDGERGSYQVEVTGRLYYFVNSLKERLKYVFSVKARTKVGWGNATEGTVTLGPQIGSPDRPSKPEITAGDTSITLEWQTFFDGGSAIQGYIIQAKKADESKWSALLRLNTPEPEVVVPLSNLAENTEYRFRVIAFNADSISEPSEPSEVFIKEKQGDPFYIQWWFLVIVALTGVIFIIMVIFILCLTGRNSKDKYKARRSLEKRPGHNPNLHYFTYPADQINRMPTTILQPSDTTQTFADPVEGNDEGFATFDTRRSQRRSHRGPPSSRRSDITTLPPYSRTPPRPSPSSVNYSDPDEDRKSFPDSGSDITEKPSEGSDSEVGSQASQSDNEDYPDLAGASGGAAGAAAGSRPSSFVSNYVANGDVRNSWKRQAHSKPFNAAYSYTDSEQDSSHYAMSLNGGVIMMNNMAGSRAPLPGFSSFV